MTTTAVAREIAAAEGCTSILLTRSGGATHAPGKVEAAAAAARADFADEPVEVVVIRSTAGCIIGLRTIAPTTEAAAGTYGFDLYVGDRAEPIWFPGPHATVIVAIDKLPSGQVTVLLSDGLTIKAEDVRRVTAGS